MQVTHAKESDSFIAIGGENAVSFKVAASAAAFRIMSDTLYRDKERATVREVMCNAIDANIMSGLGDEPIEVTLTDDEFVVKDQGPGIPHAKIDEIYCTLFGSTKAKDKRMTGGFGLGSKSPWSITDHFTVTSCHEGEKSLYAMVANDPEFEGCPSAKRMMKTGTMERGLTVSIPLAQGMRTKIEQAIVQVAIEGGMKVRLNGNLLHTPDYAGMRDNGYGLVEGFNQFRSGNIHVLYANVLYPLDDHEELRTLSRRLQEFQADGKRMVLAAPPSTVGVTPSREALSYDEETIAELKKLLGKAVRELEAAYRTALTAVLNELVKDLSRHELANWRRHSQNLPYPSEVAATPESIAHLVALSHLRSGHVPEKEAIRAMLRHHKDDVRALRVMTARGYIGRRHYHHRFGTYVERAESLSEDRNGYILRRFLRAIGSDAVAAFYRKDRAAGRCYAVRSGAERNRYVDESFPFELRFAPTVTIAQTRRINGYFLITGKLKPTQVARIRKACERLKIPVADIERPVEVAEKEPRTKAKPMFGPPCPPKLNCFTALERHYNSRNEDDQLVTRSLYGASLFKPVAIYTAKFTSKQNGWVGAYTNHSEELSKLVHKHVGRTAIVLQREELEDIRVKGLPRVERIVLDKIKARVKRRRSYESFYAKLARRMADLVPVNERRENWDQSRLRGLAGTMMRMNREFAHAAVRERYKPDADRDEAYELWFLACLLFKDRNKARGYFDKDEADLMIDLYDEWRTLAQPLEVQKFGEDPIWTRIEHLKLFASAYSSHELDELKKGAREDFLFCVNQLGQRFEAKKEKI